MTRIKVLVPCDFSPTALNAAAYAAQMAYDSGVPAELHLVYVLPSGSNIGSDGSPISGEDHTIAAGIMNALQELQVGLYAKYHVPCDVRMEEGELVTQITKLLNEENFVTVVMGITGGDVFTEKFLGSNALDIIEKNDTPVVIVPHLASYKGFKKIALALELKEGSATVPSEKITAWLKIFKPKLDIVYVNHAIYVELNDEEKAEQEVLKQTFAEFNPGFSNMTLFDFVDAINAHVHETETDMVMVVPRHHSLLDRLFGPETHLKKLAFHSHKPVVAIHDL